MKGEKAKPIRNKVYNNKAKDDSNKYNKTRNQNLPRSKDPYIRNATKTFKDGVILAWDDRSRSCPNYPEFVVFMKNKLSKAHPGAQAIVKGDFQEKELTSEQKSKCKIRKSDNKQVKKIKKLMLKALITSTVQYNIDMCDNFPKIYTLIWESCSKPSQAKIKAHHAFKSAFDDEVSPPIRDPAKLFQIIRETHQGFTGGNKKNVELAISNYKQKLYSTKQGDKEYLSEWYDRLENLMNAENDFVRNNLIIYDDDGDEVLDDDGNITYRIINTEADYISQFITGLNGYHSGAKSDFLNRLNRDQVEQPDSLSEAYNEIKDYLDVSKGMPNQGPSKVFKIGTKRGRERDNTGERNDDEGVSNYGDPDRKRNNKTPGDCYICLELEIEGDKRHYVRDCLFAKKMSEKKVKEIIRKQAEAKKAARTDDAQVKDDTNPGNAFNPTTEKPNKKRKVRFE